MHIFIDFCYSLVFWYLFFCNLCLQYIDEDAEGHDSRSDDDDDEEGVGDAVPIDSLKIGQVYLAEIIWICVNRARKSR